MLAERLSALPKSAMAPVPAPAPGPAMANAMSADLAEVGSSRRLQAAQAKMVAGRGAAAAPAGAVAGKVRPLRSSAFTSCAARCGYRVVTTVATLALTLRSRAQLPLMADSGAPAAGMDLAEATLPADTVKVRACARCAASRALRQLTCRLQRC